ncbi:hypothetical protein [Acidovorax sp. RAC01]|uniref:hypothetical protein n=1 Tax=Acidovorax sp. RAC01 TaxID=1842533 RepID=UPI00083E78D9|nr:hypothetical protein [Acidovorax sp. RAC01]AOG22730.1 hypothetical protein BSY15_3859 [Acidovorax sp. RAC01]AOG23935.1 hypothetical protein BSY15_3782 [Acidovorax sp. RAC01]
MTPAEVTQNRLARIRALHQLQPLRWNLEPQPEPEHRTCLGCGLQHPVNPDGTPVGGCLPCGH